MSSHAHFVPFLSLAPKIECSCSNDVLNESSIDFPALPRRPVSDGSGVNKSELSSTFVSDLTGGDSSLDELSVPDNGYFDGMRDPLADDDALSDCSSMGDGAAAAAIKTNDEDALFNDGDSTINPDAAAEDESVAAFASDTEAGDLGNDSGLGDVDDHFDADQGGGGGAVTKAKKKKKKKTTETSADATGGSDDEAPPTPATTK